jgi:hypothetical protein
VGLSIISRGMRFYLIAFLLSRYGLWARALIERRLALWASVGAGVVVIGVIAALRLF